MIRDVLDTSREQRTASSVFTTQIEILYLGAIVKSDTLRTPRLDTVKNALMAVKVANRRLFVPNAITTCN